MFIDTAPARPWSPIYTAMYIGLNGQANYPSHVATGVSTPLPSPTVTTTVQSKYSGYAVSRLDLTRAGVFTYGPLIVVKRL